MTTILTSSFGAWRPSMGAPVVTSLTVPRWRPEAASWPRCELLTPKWSYFKAEPEEFERRYLEQLTRHGPRAIAARLAQIAAYSFAERQDTVVLLCWEALASKCHRQLAADWLLATTGEIVREATA